MTLDPPVPGLDVDAVMWVAKLALADSALNAAGLGDRELYPEFVNKAAVRVAPGRDVVLSPQPTTLATKQAYAFSALVFRCSGVQVSRGAGSPRAWALRRSTRWACGDRR